MCVNPYSTPSLPAHVLSQNSKRSSIQNGNVVANGQSNNNAVKIDISEQARKISDILKLKFDLGNIPASDLEGSSIEEFLAKYKEHEEQGVFTDMVDDSNANQLLQNSILDLVDEHRAKAANDMCQSDLREMAARSDMSMFLVKALGITTGRVDISEKGIARMMELYKEKQKDGTLKSTNAEILDMDAFNKYCEKYSKEREAATKEYDTYSLLVQKFDEIKDSLVQLFKGNKDKFQ